MTDPAACPMKHKPGVYCPACGQTPAADTDT